MSAEAALKFLSTLKLAEGKLAGQRLRVADYQKKFVIGGLDPDVMVACLSVARGSAKTALSAGVALAHLMGKLDKQPKREVLFAARNRDQAKIAYSFLCGFIEGLPPTEQKKFTIRHGQRLEVAYSGNGGGLARCIAADAKSILGGAPTFAVLDERAAWETAKGQALENSIMSGLGKRNGRAWIISTSAPDDANAFSRWLDNPPPGTYVQEHRAPPGLPLDDLESLKIANPGSAENIGPSLEWLVAQARRAQAMGGSSAAAFRNLNRNERVSTENRAVLVTVDEWLAAEVTELPERRGPCVVGVDLGLSRSMSAFAAYWPEVSRLEVWGAFPSKPNLKDRGEADTADYSEMERRGELFTIGDQTVPAAMWLAEMMRRLDYPVTIMACDRYRRAEFGEAITAAGLRCPVIYWGQGFMEGSESIQRFKKRLADGQIKVLPSLLLRASMAETVVLRDPSANEKIAKARSLGRIDPTAATLLAVAQGDRLMAQPVRRARPPQWV